MINDFNGELMIFVASLSSYREKVVDMYDDSKSVNSMHDCLNLFEQTINDKAAPWSTNIKIVLFLNKLDLFTEQILDGNGCHDLSQCFSYNDDHNNNNNGCLNDTKYDIFEMCDKFDNQLRILNENSNNINANDHDIERINLIEKIKQEKLNANLNFVKQEFLKRNQTQQKIKVFYTCAYNAANVIDSFGQAIGIKLLPYARVPWNFERLIWIGFYKNMQNEKCLFAILPKELVKYILDFSCKKFVRW